MPDNPRIDNPEDNPKDDNPKNDNPEEGPERTRIRLSEEGESVPNSPDNRREKEGPDNPRMDRQPPGGKKPRKSKPQASEDRAKGPDNPPAAEVAADRDKVNHETMDMDYMVYQSEHDGEFGKNGVEESLDANGVDIQMLHESAVVSAGFGNKRAACSTR